MRLQIQNGRTRAFGLIEVLVIIALLAVLVALLLPILASSKRRASKISCVSNLKQINLAFRIWEGDNNNRYPMAVSVTNGGAMELIKTGNPAGCFQVASNELSATKLLVCPQDSARTFASNFDDLNGSHISYFINADVTSEEHPQMVLDGDDNFQLNGSPVKSGLVDISSSSSVEWGPGRHYQTFRPHFWSFPKKINLGNFGFADGSVSEESPSGLQNAIQYSFNGTPFPTNRIAIP